MAKVLFINPVVREEDNPMHIPYGIALLAAIAMQRGHQVQVYDHNAWRLGDEVWEKILFADDWDMIGIGGLTTTYGNIKKIVRTIKKLKPDAFIVAGGGFLTSMPREIMTWLPEIDLGVVGEAFVTFPEVLEKLDRKDYNFRDVLGVACRVGGHIVLTDARPNIKDLDDLPHPAYELFPMDIYFRNSQLLYSEEGFTSRRRVDINGSLGCNLVCRYCWHLGITGDMVIEKNEQGENDVRFTYGRNIRYHSPKYITEMALSLRDKYQIDFVSFLDENMFTMDAASNRKWLGQLSEEWIRMGLQPTCRRDGVPHDENCRGVHWGGTSHAGLHRKETLKKMFEAGCSHLVYGLETFDPKLLKQLGKGSSVDQNLSSVRICLESGIKPIPNIIVGFPEESFESVRNTILGLLKSGIHCIPHFATPYPGSEWYYAYKNDILKQYNGNLEAFVEDLGDATKITAVICQNFSAVELLGLQSIISQRNLRLLSQAEEFWKRSRQPVGEAKFTVPAESFNIVKRKVQAPIESTRRSFVS